MENQFTSFDGIKSNPLKQRPTSGLLLGWRDSSSRFIGIGAIGSKSLISSGHRATFSKLRLE